MKKVFQHTTVLLVIVITLAGCGQSSSSLSCIGAKAPVDIKLRNDGNESQVVSLFTYSQDKGFEKITQLEFAPFDVQDICMDAKDELAHGLYLFNGKDAYALTFESAKRIELSLTGKAHLITSPEQLRDILKAMQ
ncbi:hypothetical protein N7E81_13500 [Reichenbachiella carrageenanivorans]|uniref:Lipoprotein n=1 Tax=Reichenbachiella carrageenanivorans TaxID=2979869 RepID=A0ABY6CWR8_9BACT|nr:hypothetical protein [Reichenbachiella carrageenanivorans]UXX78371.1 hypothetical protein N7E81_13500 [Reichenbachiella carrageenanivorans]